MRKLAIVGTHTRTRDQAPFDDPEYEIWVFNEAPQASWCKRWDVDFQLHKREVYESPHNFVRSDHWEWLQQHHGEKRIYMQEIDERAPNSERYPLEEIIESIPGASLRWFRSSAAYAIALALYQGYEQIALYGLDMSSNTEYGYQLPNYQFWVGVAYGMGIKLEMISNEQYFRGALYAYEGEIQISREHFARRAATLEELLDGNSRESKKQRQKMLDVLFSGKPAKFDDLLAKCHEATIAAGETAGALDAAKYYGGRNDLIPRQEFERKSAQAQRDSETAREAMWIAHGEMQYVWNAWNQTRSMQARDQLRIFAEKELKFAEDYGRLKGTMRENMDYMHMVDELITAAGGQRTVNALVEAKHG